MRQVTKLIKLHGEATLAKLKVVIDDLGQKQIIALLDRATDEGRLIRKGRRRTYEVKSDEKEQLDIFS